MDTPSQAPQQHYTAPPSQATAAPAADDANPFARRKSASAPAAAEDLDENDAGNGGRAWQMLTATSTTHFFEPSFLDLNAIL